MELLLVVHSRSGGTRELADALHRGATDPSLDELGAGALAVTVASPQEVDAATIRAVQGIIVATPEHFGAMAGLVKDLFERVYEPLGDATAGMPYALVVKGRHDGAGTVRGVTAIATGLGWSEIRPPSVVIGEVTDDHRVAAYEVGATMAAGLLTGIYGR